MAQPPATLHRRSALLRHKSTVGRGTFRSRRSQITSKCLSGKLIQAMIHSRNPHTVSRTNRSLPMSSPKPNDHTEPASARCTTCGHAVPDDFRIAADVAGRACDGCRAPRSAQCVSRQRRIKPGWSPDTLGIPRNASSDMKSTSSLSTPCTLTTNKMTHRKQHLRRKHQSLCHECGRGGLRRAQLPPSMDLRQDLHRSHLREQVRLWLNEEEPPRGGLFHSVIDVLRIVGLRNPSDAECEQCSSVLHELLGPPNRVNGVMVWAVPAAPN